MRCPTLNDLPQPPPNKIGWPWSEESPQLPDTMSDGSQWPRISIVTPSLNQGKFIEETIRSVLLQGYPNLEYIIIDGGSGDGSVEIIKKYEKWLSFWNSEPDRGQSHALNKGFSRSTGELLGWLNSDDLYAESGLQRIVDEFRNHPGHMITGSVLSFNDESQENQVMKPTNISFENIVKFWEDNFICYQPGVFFPRSALVKAGGLNETYYYVMDYDLWCRLLQYCPVRYVGAIVAKFRLHATAKTGWHSPLLLKEQSRYSRSYWHLLGDINPLDHGRYMAAEFIRLVKRRFVQGHYVEAIAFLYTALQVCPRAFLKGLMTRETA